MMVTRPSAVARDGGHVDRHERPGPAPAVIVERARDELNIDFGRLQLEQATWAMSNRVDQVARERLGMRFPETAEIVVVRP